MTSYIILEKTPVYMRKESKCLVCNVDLLGMKCPKCNYETSLVVAGYSIQSIPKNELIDMMNRAATEKGIKLESATVEQKIDLLKSMGYEKFFEILRKEEEFTWL